MNMYFNATTVTIIRSAFHMPTSFLSKILHLMPIINYISANIICQTICLDFFNNITC